MKLTKTDYLKVIASAEFQMSSQTIYADNCASDFSNIYIQGNFFSDKDSISQKYLSNFENSYKEGPILSTGDFMNNLQNMVALMTPDYKEKTEDIIILPKPRNINIGLRKLIEKRKSSRDFTGESILKQELSDFLFYSAGQICKEKTNIFGMEIEKPKFSYPSGGGMYSLQLVLMIYSVRGIENGGYIYQPITHSLTKISNLLNLDNFVVTKRYDKNKADYVIIENFEPSVLICCLNNFKKQRLKYGELSLALAYTDCGCMLQNASLTAAALNLNFCIWAGFKKAKAEKALKINGINEHIIMAALLGK